MHVHKWQRVRRPPTRLPFKKEKNKTKTKQKKQGPYFLWLQAGFRSLCPLIYQRTAVLRLCDDQSPLPSVSPTQSLSRSISSSSAPSFPSNLLSVFLRFSTSLIPPHSHWASCPPLPSFLSKSLGPSVLWAYTRGTWTALGFVVFCWYTHTN